MGTVGIMLYTGGERCRMAGMNSPEMSTPQGEPARLHFRELNEKYGLHNRGIVEILGRDNYGRLLINLWGTADSGKPVNINQQMIDDGFAVKV